MKTCVLSSMCYFVIDDCIIFVNLNVEKMDTTIWKTIYGKFDILICSCIGLISFSFTKSKVSSTYRMYTILSICRLNLLK